VNFCSTCGSEKLRNQIPEGDHALRKVCASCNTVHYENPLMIVGCLVHNDKEEIMLCKRGIEPRKGFWNLPAGFLENNEGADQGAAREVLEETGAKVRIGELHTVYNVLHAKQVYLTFEAYMIDDHVELTPESTAIQFFKEADIPWDDIAFSSNTHAIKHWISKKSGSVKQLAIGTYRKKHD
jgi:ADP-ribose pyrophosphatase YjhB (NUDIX family)